MSCSEVRFLFSFFFCHEIYEVKHIKANKHFAKIITIKNYHNWMKIDAIIIFSRMFHFNKLYGGNKLIICYKRERFFKWGKKYEHL